MQKPQAPHAAARGSDRWFHPVGRLWMALGERLGVINTYIILAVAFYLVITPLALLFRLTGRDLLGLKWKKRHASYWIETSRRWPPDSFRNQF